MNVRLFTVLAFILGVATVSTTSYIWLSRSELLVRGVVRQARMDQQMVEQQLLYLQNPDNSARINGLQQSLQELQLHLVEFLSPVNAGRGIESITFEQSVLESVIQVDSTSDIVTLRLVLNLTAQHSSAILEFLNTLRQALLAWPNEFRACDMNRMPSTQISVQCIMDIYHWSYLSDEQ